MVRVPVEPVRLMKALALHWQMPLGKPARTRLQAIAGYAPSAAFLQPGAWSIRHGLPRPRGLLPLPLPYREKASDTRSLYRIVLLPSHPSSVVVDYL
jgi:hypothetical protein